MQHGDMLRDGTFYHDLGTEHFHRLSPQAQAHRLAKLITKLGFTCTLAPIQSNSSVSV
jgi:hypothetical protein